MKNDSAHTNLEVTHQESPWNAETTLSRLLDYEITPYTLLYARNHCDTLPEVDKDSYKIKIEGLVEGDVEIALQDLQEMPQQELEAAMQCAGLRRDEMNERRQTEGVAWSSCAISNCVYGGVLLKDVLAHLKLQVQDKMKYAQFSCNYVECGEDQFYGSSIPIELIESNDVILATRLNGRALPQSHGGPCRLVIPGVYGARSIKWIDTISFSTQESQCFYQQHDYKVLPKHIESQEQADAEDSWSKLEAMTRVVPESVITRVGDGNLFRGYALSGSVVKQVEVSFDEKSTWQTAKLIYQSGKWSWTLFEAEGPEDMSTVKNVYSRATDVEGNAQPEEPAWNLRGVGMNSYGVCRIE